MFALWSRHLIAGNLSHFSALESLERTENMQGSNIRIVFLICCGSLNWVFKNSVPLNNVVSSFQASLILVSECISEQLQKELTEKSCSVTPFWSRNTWTSAFQIFSDFFQEKDSHGYILLLLLCGWHGNARKHVSLRVMRTAFLQHET